MNHWNQLTQALPNIKPPVWFIRKPNGEMIAFSSMENTLWRYKDGAFTVIKDKLNINTDYLNSTVCYCSQREIV